MGRNINFNEKVGEGGDIESHNIYPCVNRLKKEDSPPKSKKIVYGTKSVLYHHHRKSRPPMFSKVNYLLLIQSHFTCLYMPMEWPKLGILGCYSVVHFVLKVNDKLQGRKNTLV